jgi:hypothetical protein
MSADAHFIANALRSEASSVPVCGWTELPL